MKYKKKFKKMNKLYLIGGLALIAGILYSWFINGVAYTSDVSTNIICILFIVFVMLGLRKMYDI